MAEESTQDRNQPATPKRRREFRERGETARSKELASVLVLLAGVGIVAGLGPWSGVRMAEVLKHSLSGLNRVDPLSGFANALSVGAGILAPAFILLAVIAVAAHVCQGGLAFSPKVLQPKWERINLFSRAKQLLFSFHTVSEAFKAVAKTVLLGALTAWFLRREWPGALALLREHPRTLGEAMARIAIGLGAFGSLSLSVVAVADLLFSRWDLEKRMKMTRQEVRDEQKEQDGDPHIRSRRRQRHRELSLNRILKEVPRADVVITNPTHLALALRYDREHWNAPRVTAKGEDHLAARIRELARKNNVPLVENKPLARALYRSAKLGQSIKPELYKAVAEIYAFLFRDREPLA